MTKAPGPSCRARNVAALSDWLGLRPPRPARPLGAGSQRGRRGESGTRRPPLRLPPVRAWGSRAVFEGFALERVELPEVTLRVRHGGSGPPVGLLHGHPRTHATWHRVAPGLAAAHTVVCPDLRGYGGSSKPATTADHAPYSKRAMAGDVVGLMRRLGHERFAVLGHDRGAYVAFRTAMDHPEAVTRLGVLDGVPIL